MIALIAAAALSSLAVDVSEPRAPYARVRLPVAVDPSSSGDYRDLRVRDDRGAEIPYVLDPDGVSSETVVAASAPAGERPADAPAAQRASIDLPNDHLEIAGVRIATATPTFARDVTVEASDDGETWTTVAHERIERFRGSPPHLEFPTDWRRAPRWRVTIDDRDDAPLADARVTLLARAHEIVFPVVRSRRYTLTWGDPALDLPSYDLATVLQHEPWHARRATLGRVVTHAAQTISTPSPGNVGRARDGTPTWLPAAGFTGAVVVLVLFALGLLRSGSAGEPRGG
ncbi:MAG TPA: hypothetical protein VHS78_19800 [Candidatus Elarobacter sp.]|nr:hypothetical protein [Candidatus Elarobacter sp.]